jgi:hypothetical protein
MRKDIVPGATFPDYELTDHTGKHRKLSELQGEDPWWWCSVAAPSPPGSTAARGLVELHRR